MLLTAPDMLVPAQSVYQNSPRKLRGRRVATTLMHPQLALSNPLFFKLCEYKLGTLQIKTYFHCILLSTHVTKPHHSMTKPPFQPAAISLIDFVPGSYSFRLKYSGHNKATEMSTV